MLNPWFIKTTLFIVLAGVSSCKYFGDLSSHKSDELKISDKFSSAEEEIIDDFIRYSMRRPDARYDEPSDDFKEMYKLLDATHKKCQLDWRVHKSKKNIYLKENETYAYVYIVIFLKAKNQSPEDISSYFMNDHDIKIPKIRYEKYRENGIDFLSYAEPLRKFVNSFLTQAKYRAKNCF